MLPQVIETVKATCPDMTKTDAQMLGALLIAYCLLIIISLVCGGSKSHNTYANPNTPPPKQRTHKTKHTAVDLAMSDFLHEPAEQRATFLEWVKGACSIYI